MPGPSSITNPSTPNFHPDLYGKNGADSTEAGPSVQHRTGQSVVTNPFDRIIESRLTTGASGQEDAIISHASTSEATAMEVQFAQKISEFIDNFSKQVDSITWNDGWMPEDENKTNGRNKHSRIHNDEWNLPTLAGAPVRPSSSFTKNKPLHPRVEVLLSKGLERTNGGTGRLTFPTLEKLVRCVAHLPTHKFAHEDKQLIAMRFARHFTRRLSGEDGNLSRMAQAVAKLATSGNVASTPHKVHVVKEFARTRRWLKDFGTNVTMVGWAVAVPVAVTAGFAGNLLHAAAKDNKNSNKALEWLQEIFTQMEERKRPTGLDDETLKACADVIAQGGGKKFGKLEGLIDRVVDANGRTPAWTRIRQETFAAKNAALGGNLS